MPRCWYYEDTEMVNHTGDSGWYTVTYESPAQYKLNYDPERAKRVRKARVRRHEEHLEAMKDPMYAHAYETKMFEDHWIRRLRKDPRYSHLPPKQMRSHIPSYSMQDTTPVVVDRRTRDEYGDVIQDTRGTRHGGARRGVSGTMRGGTNRQRESRSGSRIERDVDEGVRAKKFTKEFINNVKDARLAAGLTQEQLALKIDRKKSEVSDFESGKLAFDRGLKAILTWKILKTHKPESTSKSTDTEVVAST